MSLWKWNEVELEVDLNDVEFQEKYESAFEKMEEKEKELQKVGKTSEISRAYCGMFYSLFDNIFKDGTGKRLLGEKMNVAVCEDCYDSFIDFCHKQAVEISKKRAKTLGKYIPKKR